MLTCTPHASLPAHRSRASASARLRPRPSASCAPPPASARCCTAAELAQHSTACSMAQRGVAQHSAAPPAQRGTPSWLCQPPDSATSLNFSLSARTALLPRGAAIAPPARRSLARSIHSSQQKLHPSHRPGGVPLGRLCAAVRCWAGRQASRHRARPACTHGRPFSCPPLFCQRSHPSAPTSALASFALAHISLRAAPTPAAAAALESPVFRASQPFGQHCVACTPSVARLCAVPPPLVLPARASAQVQAMYHQ